MIDFVKRLFGHGNSRHHAMRKPDPRPFVKAPPSRPISTTPRTTTDLLDNPSLRLDTSDDDEGFDPYNTGTFNRSGSWERINKRRNS